MSTKILDGKIIRDEIAEKLAAEISGLSRKPALAVIQIGNNPESSAYIEQKKKFAARIGCEVSHIQFAPDVTEGEIIDQIGELNCDKMIDGIIVQLPLPGFSNETRERIVEVMSPEKDVDGLTAVNLKRLLSGNLSGFVPATAKGILALLDYYGIEISGKRAAVVGRSNLVGKPLALALLSRDATVTVAHSKSPDLASLTREADILISAVGKKGLIGREYVKAGQAVIDVGISTEIDVEGKRKLYGDVDFSAVSEIVDSITPVPGGIGPLTVASLFENVVHAYRQNVD